MTPIYKSEDHSRREERFGVTTRAEDRGETLTRWAEERALRAEHTSDHAQPCCAGYGSYSPSSFPAWGLPAHNWLEEVGQDRRLLTS